MRIEYRTDETLGAFVIGGEEFVFSKDGSEMNIMTLLELVNFLDARADEVELFHGPANIIWNLGYLREFVFGGSVDMEETRLALADLISKVAFCAVELKGPVTKQLVSKWFEWSIEIAEIFFQGSPNIKREVVGKLLTACQLTFNEWVNISEDRISDVCELGHGLECR